MEVCRAELQESLNRDPTRAELAAAMGVELDILDEILTTPTFLHSLDERTNNPDSDDDTPWGGDVLSRDRGADYVEVLPGDVLEILLGAVASLDDGERCVVQLYYIHGLTFAQIAAELGINESKVGMLHGRSLACMRDRLELDDRLPTSQTKPSTKA
jgi:DNA-directed RNA polymerase specialized sigma subunit